MNKIVKYLLSLVIAFAFSFLIIQLTHEYTQPIIDSKAKEKIESLYPGGKEYKILYDKNQLGDSDLLGVYEVTLADGSTVVVYETSNVGKNGEIISMIAIKGDVIDKVKNTSHKETQGIGSKIDDEVYLTKIVHQNINNLNIDTISGATLSSTALKKSIEDAAEHYKKEVRK